MNPIGQEQESPANVLAGQLAHDLDQALQHQIEPFLKRMKQITLEVVDELESKHASPFLAQLRQTLLETVAAVFKAELPALLDQLRPALREGNDAMRANADSWLGDLKQFITKTVTEVFQVHVPEYSRRAGRRMIDYFLAGTLFCLAAVLLCLGSILGLEQAGLPPFATYLIGGSVALATGMVLLKMRTRRLDNHERTAEAKEKQDWPGGATRKDR